MELAKTNSKPSRQYFLAGAMWGKDDQFERFIQAGIWQNGWKLGEHPEYDSVIAQVRKNDCIAIKKGLGQGSSDIRIRAIGIVKSVDTELGIVFVDWILTTMNRKVNSGGCYKTIHGPYCKGKDKEETHWLEKIFSL